MPFGCTLIIGSYTDGERFLASQCPGESSLRKFQALLTFPENEAAVADGICKKFGSRSGKVTETGGWGAEKSVLVINENAEVFTHEDDLRDLVVLRKFDCTN